MAQGMERVWKGGVGECKGAMALCIQRPSRGKSGTWGPESR